MNIHLVVVQGFGPHAKGDRITDPAEVAATLAGESADKVVRLSVPDTTAPSAPRVTTAAAPEA
jgi:hypothetical protein